MFYLISTSISFPWWAPPDVAQPRKKWGKRTPGVFFRGSASAEVREAFMTPRVRACMSEGNPLRGSVMRGRSEVAAAANGRRAVPAGNPGWYRSRGVSDPPLRPGDRSRPRPRGSLTSRLSARMSPYMYPYMYRAWGPAA